MCYLGKIFGSKIIYIETFANRNKKTATGRLIYPIADLFIVQWEEMLKNISKSSIWRFNISMILVLLGTQNNSFHRLLEKMDELINKGIINEKVIVQSGYTNYESKNMRVFDLIPQEELERYQEQADLIITHGGVGSIVSSIKKRKESNSSSKTS